MKVSDIMSGHVISVGQKEPVTVAARLMKRHNLGALPVCDERGNLRGLVTDRDISPGASPWTWTPRTPCSGRS